MQLLSLALPGFRDLRGPVIAGYLWFIFIWLLLQPDVTVRPEDRLAGALYDLAEQAGPVGIAVAVSVGAYLVGSVSQAISGAFATLLREGGAKLALETVFYGLGRLLWPYVNAGRALVGMAPTPFWRISRDLRIELDRPGTEEIARSLGRARAALSRAMSAAERADNLAALSRLERDLEERAQQAVLEVDRELSLPATLLVGESPELSQKSIDCERRGS